MPADSESPAMAAHSETTDHNYAGTTLEEVSDECRAWCDSISRRLRQTAWLLRGLYVYLLAGMLWVYFENLS